MFPQDFEYFDDEQFTDESQTQLLGLEEDLYSASPAPNTVQHTQKRRASESSVARDRKAPGDDQAVGILRRCSQ